MSNTQHPEPGPPDRSARAGSALLRNDLRRAIEHEIVPQLLSLHDRRSALSPDTAVQEVRQPTGMPASGTPDFAARLAVDLAMDSVGPHPERVGARLDRLLDGGADPQELCLQVLAPAARHLGQLWVEDRLDFVDVTLGTMRLERSLRGLLADTAPSRRVAGAGPVRAPSILMMPLPGNQHTFGLSMAADFFRRAGWIVSDGTGCGLPGSAPDRLDGLEQHLRTHRLDAIGLAVSCETQAERLTRALRMIRASSCNNRIRIALGGPLFLVQPGMASRFDADLVVTDGARAPLQLATLLPESDSRRPSPGSSTMFPA